MIGKKFHNPKKTSSKATRVTSLVDYITEPEKEGKGEKCIYTGARGFILADDVAGYKTEMLALSQEAVRSKDTVNHYLLSWREGEKQPTPEQIEEAVDVLLDELGLTDHQAVYGLHDDTNNIHLHIAVNRVHPDTLKMIAPNRGFDREAIHKALARIEHAQGWERERNGRYQVLENGDLARTASDPDKPRQPEQRKRDMENQTGEKSAERVAIETGAPIIKAATSWKELHEQLAEQGMRYEKVGSGAVVFVGDVGVKASSADRNATLSKLQKRLGDYEPAPERLKVEPRAPEPLKKGVYGWDAYVAERKAYSANNAKDKDAATLAQRTQHASERNALFEAQKKDRAIQLGGSWKGKGKAKNGLRSVLAYRNASEKAELKERHQQERLKLREQYGAFPNFEQWLRQQNPALAEQWRYRDSSPQQMQGDRTEPPTLRDIRDFTPTIRGDQVHYTRDDKTGRGHGSAFVDKGRDIDVHDWHDKESLLAALQLSAQKWGKLTINGSNEYKALCVELAVRHGFKINNPELQPSIEKEQQRLHQQRIQAMAKRPIPPVKKPEQEKER